MNNTPPNNDELERAVERREGLMLSETHDEQIGAFQNQVRDLIIKMIPACNPDGGGCESGDWRDFTLSEIGQGLAHIIDERDSLQHQLSRYKSALEMCEKALQNLNVDMSRLHPVDRTQRKLASDKALSLVKQVLREKP